MTVFDCSKPRRQALTGLEVASSGATERLNQQFQAAFIDNGDGVLRAMSANVVFNLVGVTRVSRTDLPIVIDLMAAKNW